MHETTGSWRPERSVSIPAVGEVVRERFPLRTRRRSSYKRVNPAANSLRTSSRPSISLRYRLADRWRAVYWRHAAAAEAAARQFLNLIHAPAAAAAAAPRHRPYLRIASSEVWYIVRLLATARSQTGAIAKKSPKITRTDAIGIEKNDKTVARQTENCMQ